MGNTDLCVNCRQVVCADYTVPVLVDQRERLVKLKIKLIF